MTANTALSDSRVAHVFSRMEPGGAELRTIEVVKRSNAAFDFIAVSGGSGSLDEALREEGHSVHKVRLVLRNFPRLRRLMRTRRYAVMHSHLGLASGPILLLALMAGVPRRIAHFRSDAVGGEDTVRKRIYLWVSRLLIALIATHIVGVSPGSLQHGWHRRWRNDARCEVIPNGFDVKRLREEAYDGQRERAAEMGCKKLVVVNVGRADPVKNRGRALRIWADLASTRESRLYLVGTLSGTDLSAAEEHVQLDSDVVVVGDVSSAGSHVGRSDVLLATSTREGLPGVVLEALAVGTPVVASKLPGTEWIASLLPGMELCSLTSDNSQWVSAIERASGKDRAEIAAAFDQSPFLIDRSVEAFCRLWGLDASR